MGSSALCLLIYLYFTILYVCSGMFYRPVKSAKNHTLLPRNIVLLFILWFLICLLAYFSRAKLSFKGYSTYDALKNHEKMQEAKYTILELTTAEQRRKFEILMLMSSFFLTITPLHPQLLPNRLVCTFFSSDIPLHILSLLINVY